MRTRRWISGSRRFPILRALRSRAGTWLAGCVREGDAGASAKRTGSSHDAAGPCGAREYQGFTPKLTGLNTVMNGDGERILFPLFGAAALVFLDRVRKRRSAAAGARTPAPARVRCAGRAGRAVVLCCSAKFPPRVFFWPSSAAAWASCSRWRW